MPSGQARTPGLEKKISIEAFQFQPFPNDIPFISLPAVNFVI